MLNTALEQQHLTAVSGLSEQVALTIGVPSRKVYIPSSSCREASELTPKPEVVSLCWDAREGIIASGPWFLTQQSVLTLSLWVSGVIPHSGSRRGAADL